MAGDLLVPTDSNSSKKCFIQPSNKNEDHYDSSSYKHNRLNKWLVAALIMSVIGIAFPIGHNMGVINNAQDVIRNWINETAIIEYGTELTSYTEVTIWSLAVSLFVVGATIGSLVASFVANSIGRRRGLLFTNMLNLITATLFMMCRSVYWIELLMIGRFISGITSGLGTGIVPLYLSEICPPNLKGVMGTFLPFGITSGLLLAQIFGTSSLMGTADRWPFLVGGLIVYVVIGIIVYPFTPSSPTYLAIIKKDIKSAEKELKHIKSGDYDIIEEELNRLKASCSKSNKEEEWSVTKILKENNDIRRNFICVIVLNAGQQLIGINAVFYYSTLIFSSAGLNLKESQLASLGCAIINVVMSVSAVILIRFFRRKVLMAISLVIYVICQLTLLFSLKYLHFSATIPYVAIVALNGSVFGYGIGLGPVPYMFGTETLPDGPRAIGISLGAVSNYICNLIVSFCFPLIQKKIEEDSFGIFIVISLFLGAFVYGYMPESFKKIKETQYEGHYIPELEESKEKLEVRRI